MENTTVRRRGRPRAFDIERATQRAAHLFWRRGYEGVSVDELTAAMGITTQSFYAAFGSKEALHRAALAWYDRTISGPVRDALEAEADAVKAIRVALRLLARNFATDDLPAGCMRSIAGLGVSTANDVVARHGAAMRAETVAFLRTRLVRGISEGQIATGTDVEAVSAYLGAAIVGMAVAAHDGAAVDQLLAVADLVGSILPSKGQHGDRSNGT